MANGTYPDGKVVKLVQVHCRGCLNAWYVYKGPEFIPSFCCYCNSEVIGSDLVSDEEFERDANGD